MTALVGVLCTDGVVVGTDSAASFTAGQAFTIKQKVKKLWVAENCAIVAGTGQVGMGQRFTEIVGSTFTNNKCKNKKPLEVARELAAASHKDFVNTGAHQGQFGALVAFGASKETHLCEFATRDFQPELKNEKTWFVSMGSGQPITDPFLGLLKKAFFADTQPTLAEGIFTVTWTLQNVFDLCVGHIDGPSQIGVLTKKDDANFAARILTDDEITQHEENARGAERHLAEYKNKLQSNKPKEDIPEPPPTR